MTRVAPPAGSAGVPSFSGPGPGGSAGGPADEESEESDGRSAAFASLPE
ncbi:hypothetical protein [Streptomyces beigongshangae]|nr:hypothetical protein [Streptomyces sp. REN17]